MANVVSLYDESGNMLRPWAEAGHNCYCIDILNDNRSERVGAGWLHFVKADMLDPGVKANVLALKPIFISSFPPCTDLAVLGAKHFEAKAAKNPNYRKEAMDLVYMAKDIIEEAGCPGFFENPVSVISTEYRKPDFYFHPNEYGGYLPEDDCHPRWPDYIEPRDGYTKKTCIWAFNGFTMPDKLEVPLSAIVEFETADGGVVRGSKQWGKLGGKSAKTKQIRSETPRGFARAVYLKYGKEPGNVVC
jgi:hypothetical protein